MAWFYEHKEIITPNEIKQLIKKSIKEAQSRISGNHKKVLLLPPDITRAHSGAGWITEELFYQLSEKSNVWIMPTLGQHSAHTDEQNKWMFGSIPKNRILKHNWRTDCIKLGTIQADYVRQVTEDRADWDIPVTVNKILFEEKWDIIINIGHVVPHEVLGYANHNKNYFIGLGGKEIICASHMAAACYGIENNLGRLVTPLRHCFNKAESEFLSELPDFYIQLVMGYNNQSKLVHKGFYCGDDLDTYLLAAEHSRKENITIVEPLKKVIAVMQGDEFYSTWVANKAIYRTRKAMADDGELIIIAPGLKRFGEQEAVDRIIRKYGYTGTENIMKLWREEPELQDLSHATAHLIHGSTEGRFKVTYAPGYLQKEDIENVNFSYLKYEEAVKEYCPENLSNGYNTLPSGEKVYFIGTPSAGLWSTKEKMNY